MIAVMHYNHVLCGAMSQSALLLVRHLKPGCSPSQGKIRTFLEVTFIVEMCDRRIECIPN